VVRGKLREDAILVAVLELLAEGGYRALTMDAVAARARASKSTIYRRWRNKPEMVKAALDAHDAHSNDAVADTGSLRGDLIAVLDMLRIKSTQLPVTLFHDLMRAADDDPQLRAALDEHLADEQLSPVLAPLQRAIIRGDIPADTDTELIHDVTEALIMRQLTLGAFDDAFITRIVDDVLLVLLGQGRP
jgi:AcrR family transcriptional regulator